MFFLLLLHSLVLPLLLIYCSKHNEEKGETNERVTKDENKELDNTKKEDQTDIKNKKKEDDKGVSHDEKDHQKKQDGNRAGCERDIAQIQGKDDGDAKFVDPNPDYRKLSGMSEAQMKELEEINLFWCVNEKKSYLRRLECERKMDERMKRRREGEIVESTTQRSSPKENKEEEESTQNSFDDKEDKKEDSKKEKFKMSKSKKPKTDKTQKSEKV